MNWRTDTSDIHHADVNVNCTPAWEGGARGTPPSTLPQLTRRVARGTLAQPGRFARLFNNGTSLAERIRGLASSQMAAQTRLMATVALSNKLICSYMNVSSAPRTDHADAPGFSVSPSIRQDASSAAARELKK